MKSSTSSEELEELDLKVHYITIVCTTDLLKRSWISTSYRIWRKLSCERSYTLSSGIALIDSFKWTDGQLNFVITSSTGFLYTGCNSKLIFVWDKTEVVGRFYSKSGSINSTVVSPQGHIIASHYDGTIKVWKRHSTGFSHYNQVVTLPTPKDRIVSMFCRLNYNVRDLYRHDAPISCLCLSKDMKFLYSGSWDHTIKVWRVRNWQLVESIKGHTEKINAITIGYDDMMFSGSIDGSIRMFKRIEGRSKHFSKHQFIYTLLSGRASVNVLLFKYAEDGRGDLYAGLADGTLRFWQNRTGWKHPMTLVYHKQAITSVVGLSSRPLVFSSSLDGNIGIWSRERYEHKLLTVLNPHQGSLKCLAIQDDWEKNEDNSHRYILYSNGQDGTIKIWRINCAVYNNA